MLETKQPLMIYNSEDYQLRKLQEDYNAKNRPALIVDRQHLIPFVVKKIKSHTSGNQTTYNTPILFTDIQAQNLNNSNDTQTGLEDNLTFQYGVEPDSVLQASSQIYEYAFYDGSSTISTLPQGKYQLYLKDADNNEYYSEVFRVKFPDNTCKLTFKNSQNINGFWFYSNKPYWFVFDTFEYNSSEFNELKYSAEKIDGHLKTTFHRITDVYAIDVLCDTRTVSALRTTLLCDEVYMTNQNSETNEIQVLEVVAEEITKLGHVSVTIKYRYKNDDISTSDTHSIDWIAVKEGSNPTVTEQETGIFKSGKRIVKGTKRLKKS